MLEYFPEIYPDELLYSVLGRLKCHLGITSPLRLMIDAFGSRALQAGPFVQTNLRGLAANIPPTREITAQQLALDTTLLPYITAYQPQEVRDWAMSAITGNEKRVGGISTYLGVAGGDVRFPGRLRYCPSCRVEMLMQQGELYWRREHQLPGVLVCRTHETPLAESLVTLIHTGSQEYIAADESNCPPSPAPPLWVKSRDVVEILVRTAQASAFLLTAPPPARPLDAWSEEIHNALRDRGFGRGSCWIDLPALREAHLKLFGPIFDIVPEAESGAWLVRTIRKHYKALAPLRHILIRQLIGSVPVVVSANPFGPGPWPCRNQLAEHFGQCVITDCKFHKEKGKIIGVFRCSCGHAFSIAAEEGSRARVLDHGQLFESRLRDLVTTGSRQNIIAEALHVSPNTVKYHVARLGLESSWKIPPSYHKIDPVDREKLCASMRAAWTNAHIAAPTLTRTQLRQQVPSAYEWLRHNDHDWLKMQPPYRAKSALNKPQGNRHSIDAELAESLRREAALLQAQNPPQRVTQNALERALGHRGRLRNLQHLPLSASSLSELLESTEEFQSRRIIWAVEELRRRDQPMTIRRLLALAGLSWKRAPDVKHFLGNMGYTDFL